MQGRDDGHAQITQESQDVTAGPPADDAILELQADQVHTVDIQEVGGAPIRLKIFLRQFKSNARWIRVAVFDVVHRHGNASRVTVFGGNGLAQIGGKRRYAALARQVISNKRNPADR